MEALLSSQNDNLHKEAYQRQNTNSVEFTKNLTKAKLALSDSHESTTRFGARTFRCPSVYSLAMDILSKLYNYKYNTDGITL